MGSNLELLEAISAKLDRIIALLEGNVEVEAFRLMPDEVELIEKAFEDQLEKSPKGRFLGMF